MINGRLTLPGDHLTTLHFAASHFTTICQRAVVDHDFCAVALAGGSTPQAVYTLICHPPYSQEIEWNKLYLFWSDERSVPPTHPESNYKMAMEAGFHHMQIPPHHIHRMVAESRIEIHSLQYEQTLCTLLGGRPLDLVLLGMGEDGHTASLFPRTAALHTSSHLVVPNYVPEKKTWRMTLTYQCINAAAHIVFYVMGKEKAATLAYVFEQPPSLPCQFVGTAENPASWIVDDQAASLLPLRN